jgi:hypothetical protein
VNVQDPLKPLDQMLLPDPRHRDEGIPGLTLTVERLHAALADIQLHESVPMEVRQTMETAKNVSLYSWLVYRFDDVARMTGYQAFELALRLRVAKERAVEVKAVRAPLWRLLDLADERKWLRSERFSVVIRRARANLQEEQVFEAIRNGTLVDGQELPPITEGAVLERAKQSDYVKIWKDSLRHLRNHLAHGGSLLSGKSAVGSLRTVAEAINQLFEELPCMAGEKSASPDRERRSTNRDDQ